MDLVLEGILHPGEVDRFVAGATTTTAKELPGLAERVTTHLGIDRSRVRPSAASQTSRRRALSPLHHRTPPHGSGPDRIATGIAARRCRVLRRERRRAGRHRRHRRLRRRRQNRLCGRGGARPPRSQGRPGLIEAAVTDTPVGPFTVLARADMVIAAGFTEDVDRLLGYLDPPTLDEIRQVRSLGPISDAVDAYLAGDVAAIDSVPVAGLAGQGFRERAWRAMRRIPPAGLPPMAGWPPRRERTVGRRPRRRPGLCAQPVQPLRSLTPSGGRRGRPASLRLGPSRQAVAVGP